MPKSRGRKQTKGRAAGGRVTPKPAAAPAPAAAPPAQPGRRPSSPGFLLAVAVAWIAAGVIALVRLDASWKLIPGVVFIGIGLLFLRGAAATVVRRDERER
ncbi:MAG TPA: hypothetical protein VFJ85_04145 [Acidimicrobiales bacterium]|nr:hypothetical protein [Acidimicrobiales bacterium]